MPYSHQGYFPTHDGEWAVVRMGDMFRSLRDGQFPVRYSGNLNFGYGYPLFNFAYPGPYYLGTIFHVFNIGFVDSVKLLFALSVIISAFTMYLASKALWKNTFAGAISAIFYIYFPYRIVDLYARGSIGESLSFMLFPLIIFCIAKVLDEKKGNNYFFIGVVSYAFLILTHNIMAVLFSPILFLFIIAKIVFSKKSKMLIRSSLFISLSYGLSAFFWLPALLEKKNILLSKIPIADRELYFVSLDQLLLPKWGYGLPNHPDGFSYQIGPAYVVIIFILAFIVVLTLLKKRKKPHEEAKIAFSLSVILLVFLLLLFSFTATIWQVTPLLKEINYPWTLLGPIGFLISLLAGYVCLQNKIMRYVVSVLAIIAILFALPHAKPAYFFDKGDDYYLTNDATTTSSQELMPLWVKDKPIQMNVKKVELLKGKGTIKEDAFTSKRGKFELNLNSESLIRINKIYYPGWKVTVDGLSVPISYNNDRGLMEFKAGSGTHHVEASFGETQLRFLSNIISLVSFLILLFVTFRFNNHKEIL